MTQSAKLSIVMPCYNEAAGIEVAIDRLIEIMNQTDICYEIVLVDDGSKDDTFSAISKKAETNRELVKVVSFTRNFGKEAAMFAGLSYAQGDCVVMIDSDLQHPPEIIPKMYRLWQDGYEIVEGMKKERQKEGFIKKAVAKTFYNLFSGAIGVNIQNSSDFKLLDRKVVNTLLSFREKNTFFRGLTFWTGYTMTTVEYEVAERAVGESKWSFFGLVRYAITNIVSFSSAPLKAINVISVCMFILAFIFSFRALYLYFAGVAAGGITTVVILLLFVGGLILSALSIIGEYISKIYEELKDRPRYIVGQTANIETESKEN